MKITKEMVEEKSVDELLEILKPIYDGVYEKYSFLDYLYSDFLESVKGIILETKENYPEISYSLFLKKCSEKVIIKNLSMQLSDSQNGVKVIHRFLAKNVDQPVEVQYKKFKSMIENATFDPATIPILLTNDYIFKNIMNY